MTDQDTQKSPDGELSPAEKLAQPVAQPQETDQKPAEVSENNTEKKSTANTPAKSQGVPVAKLSGIGVPVAVVLFILAFLWKGPVFAVGVLAAIALALAVVWAVRTVASRPASRSTSRPAATPRTSRTARTSQRPSSRGGGGGGSRNSTRRNNQSESDGNRSRLPWKRRPGDDKKTLKSTDRQPGGRKPGDQSKQNPTAPGSKGRPPAVDPNKAKQQPPTGRPPASKTTDRNTTKAPSGTKSPQGKAPSSTTTKSTQGSQGRPGSNGGSPALVKMVDPAPPVRPTNAKGTDGDRDRTDRGKNGGAKDRAGNGGGDASKPKTSGEKSNSTEPKKPKKDKEDKDKKAADTTPQAARKPSAPVDPRTQWVVQPGTAVQQPTDPKIQALADKVRAAGGATPAPPRGVVSLEDKRHRNLGDAIRKAGEAHVQSVNQQTTGPAKFNKKDDQERFNAVYGQMIDLSTPQTKADTLRQVSETARRDQLRLSGQADEMRGAAAGLPEKGYEEDKARMLLEAARLEEDSETRGHWAVAAGERAEQFAAELNGVAI